MNLIIVAAGLAALWMFGGSKRGSAPSGPPLPSTPAGEALRQLGERVDADLRAKGEKYDRGLLSSFQAAAGIAVDGLYGPESAAALARAIGRSAPAPIFSPKGVEAPPSTPPSPTELDEARDVARRVAADVAKKAMAYDRDLVRAFQRLARLGVDGLYGPATAGAVQYFTGATPPAPLYKGQDGTTTIKPYVPPK